MDAPGTYRTQQCVEAFKPLADFNGNILRGDLRSRTALRLVREWIDLHVDGLSGNRELARAGRSIKEIAPLT
jgi:hypothetical protein